MKQMNMLVSLRTKIFNIKAGTEGRSMRLVRIILIVDWKYQYTYLKAKVCSLVLFFKKNTKNNDQPNNNKHS